MLCVCIAKNLIRKCRSWEEPEWSRTTVKGFYGRTAEGKQRNYALRKGRHGSWVSPSLPGASLYLHWQYLQPHLALPYHTYLAGVWLCFTWATHGHGGALVSLLLWLQQNGQLHEDGFSCCFTEMASVTACFTKIASVSAWQWWRVLLLFRQDDLSCHCQQHCTAVAASARQLLLLLHENGSFSATPRWLLFVFTYKSVKRSLKAHVAWWSVYLTDNSLG